MQTPVPVSDFPLLERSGRGGNRLIYLDSGATSQRPISVIDAEMAFLKHANGAVRRGSHILAEEATEAFEHARANVASFIGGQPENLVWTKNSTEALNLLSYGILNLSLSQPGHRLALREGDEVVVTRAEHHANLVPWQHLCDVTGATLKWIDVVRPGDDNQGRLDLDTLSVVTEKTKIVSVTHVSNVTGAVTDLAPIVRAAREVGAVIFLDACQSVPHMSVDVSQLGVDALAFSGHKMLGPTGIGALWARSEILEDLPPFLTGGSMVETVTMEKTTFAQPPAKFEAGTQMVSQAVGLSAAVDYLRRYSMDAIEAHEQALTHYALENIRDIPGVSVIGPLNSHDRVGAIAFDVAGVHPHDVGQVLDSRGVLVRVGHHCAQPIHQAFDVFSSSRASIGPYNTKEDIDIFLDALSGVRAYFGEE